VEGKPTTKRTAWAVVEGFMRSLNRNETCWVGLTLRDCGGGVTETSEGRVRSCACVMGWRSSRQKRVQSGVVGD